MAGKYTPPPIVAEVTKKWDETKSHHDTFCRQYERSERAYRGLLSAASDAAKWQHKHAPKYAFNLIETIVANTIEMGLRFDTRPAPHCQVSLEEAQQMIYQAEAVGDMLRHEHRIDEMEFKQRPLFLSVALCGIGIGKPHWNYTTGPTTRKKHGIKNIHDANGNVVLQVPTITEEKTLDVVRDHSTTEVIDPRDWVTNESAAALQPLEPRGAQFVVHRCWYSYEQLLMMQQAGFFQNVELLKESLDFSDEYKDREQSLWDKNRTKDLIEVLEFWKFEDGIVKRAYVGNRMCLLRGGGEQNDSGAEDSPFTHNQYPFFVCSATPQLNSYRGVSDMELIEDIQSMIWEISNQRFDNIELINNWITLISKDVEDPEAFERYPGAFWEVEHPDQVQTLQPPYQLMDATMNAEAGLRTDLQNVTSAAPFAGGTQLAAVQQNTATGASIVMNAAQQRMVAKKYQSQQGLRQEANMRIKLCQQFISDTRLVHILGPDGAMTWRNIDPVGIQGEFVAELEPMGESQMRQEKRAEALQIGQVFMQWAPLMAAAGQPVNVKEIFMYVAKRWGMDDAERYFSMKPAAAGAMQAGPGGPPQAGPPAGGPNLGVTAGSAVDASSPSAAGGISGSPVVAAQRALALGGGPNNR